MRFELVGIVLSVLSQAPPRATPAPRVFQQLVTQVQSARLEAVQGVRGRQHPATHVVCGMTVVIPDPAMLRMPTVTPPSDRAYTLRVQEPQVCFNRD